MSKLFFGSGLTSVFSLTAGRKMKATRSRATAETMKMKMNGFMLAGAAYFIKSPPMIEPKKVPTPMKRFL